MQLSNSIQDFLSTETQQRGMGSPGDIWSFESTQIQPDVDHNLPLILVDDFGYHIGLAAQVPTLVCYLFKRLLLYQIFLLYCILVLVHWLHLVLLLPNIHLLQLGVLDSFQLEDVVIGVVSFLVLPDADLLVDVYEQQLFGGLYVINRVEHTQVAVVRASHDQRVWILGC